MIVDSSAIVSIIRSQESALFCSKAVGDARTKRISAANYLEVCIVIDGSKDPVVSQRVDEILAEADIVIEPVTEQQAKLARAAYRDFGKGSGHPARLNFGDCFAYALAKDKRETLLCVGDDFVHTDLKTICA